MLWVHFESDRVIEVYAKRYIFFGADDQGAYGLTDDRRWEGSAFKIFPK